jgi:oligoendopeptidase F
LAAAVVVIALGFVFLGLKKEIEMKEVVRGKYPSEWDLRCFYDSIDSRKVEIDKGALSERIDKFVSEYVEKLSVDNLPLALYELEEIDKLVAKLVVYFSLYYQTRIKDGTASAAYQSICEWCTRNDAKLRRFVVEMQHLDYEEIKKKLEKDSEFFKYKTYIEEVFRFKKYTLSAPEESVISRLQVVTNFAWHEFHEGTLSRINFPFDGKVCTLSDVIEMANCGETDEIRENATIALSRGFRDNSYALLSVFNNITLSHQVHGDIRKYEDPESYRYVSDNIDKQTVDMMLSAISHSYKSICHRYHKIKARLLGKRKLKYWDRCSRVKLCDTKETCYTYEQVADLVLSVFKNFSSKFYQITQRMLNEGWVDAYPKDGKISGAFSCRGTVDTHPFILLNFYGRVRDILTMAHEFGHGIHQTLSAKNPQLVCDPALNISETASLFAEKLTHKYLLSAEDDPRKKIEMMCSRLDDVMSTVFRQVAFFKFEQKIHRLRREKELSIEDLNGVWREVLSESLGEDVELDSCVDNLWGYVTHFTKSPFYVYSYAFGCLFVEGLFTEYEKQGVDFVTKYEEALSCGNTKSYREIAEMFGINVDSIEFWNSALRGIEKEIDDLEALCGQVLFN